MNQHSWLQNCWILSGFLLFILFSLSFYHIFCYLHERFYKEFSWSLKWVKMWKMKFHNNLKVPSKFVTVLMIKMSQEVGKSWKISLRKKSFSLIVLLTGKVGSIKLITFISCAVMTAPSIQNIFIEFLLNYQLIFIVYDVEGGQRKGRVNRNKSS